MKLSSGIPNDIDLTEHGNFRKGAPNLLHQKEYKHGVLPWNSDGKLKVRPVRHSTYFHRNEDWNTLSSWSNIDMSGIVSEMYIDDLEYVESDADLTPPIKMNFDGKYEITEDPKSLIPFIENSNVKIFGDAIIASSLFTAKFKNVDSDIDYIENVPDMFQYITFGRSNTSTNDVWNRDIHSQILSSVSSSTMIRDYKNLKFNLTPKIFQSVTLSSNEMNDEKLICGKGDELKLKLRKYKYLKEVKKLLNEYNKPERYLIKECPSCKQKYVAGILGHDKWGAPCPECKIMKNIFLLNHNVAKYHFDKRDFEDFFHTKMRGHGFKSFDDQDNQFSKNFDTIDFYRQCRYQDREDFSFNYQEEVMNLK